MNIITKSLLSLLVLSLSTFTVAKSVRSLSLRDCFNLQKSIDTGKLFPRTPDVEAKIASLHDDLSGLDYQGIIQWSEKDTTVRKRQLALLQLRFMAKKPPAFDKLQKLGPAKLNIDELHFSQLAASSKSGEYTVVGNAKAIRDGTLNVSIFPKLRVWRDVNGKVWTLDHRRLAAMRLSGVINEVEVEFVKQSRVNLERFKFSTESDGKSMFLAVKEEDPSKEVVIVITNDGKRLAKEK